MTDPRADLLEALDDALSGVRRVWMHPERRRRLLAAIGAPVEAATLRLLAVIDRGGCTGGPPTVGDVADALDIDPSTASRFVARAAQDGYLERVPDPEDRRRAALRLTEGGRALLARTYEVRRAFLARLTQTWPDDDLAIFVELLSRLRAELDHDRADDP